MKRFLKVFSTTFLSPRRDVVVRSKRSTVTLSVADKEQPTYYAVKLLLGSFSTCVNLILPPRGEGRGVCQTCLTKTFWCMRVRNVTQCQNKLIEEFHVSFFFRFQVLFGGPIMDFQCHDTLLNKRILNNGLWGDDYHEYSVRWAPGNHKLHFYVILTFSSSLGR